MYAGALTVNKHPFCLSLSILCIKDARYIHMLKEDRNGHYVVIGGVNGEVRKYADHRFRTYEEDAGWDSTPLACTAVM